LQLRGAVAAQERGVLFPAAAAVAHVETVGERGRRGSDREAATARLLLSWG